MKTFCFFFSIFLVFGCPNHQSSTNHPSPDIQANNTNNPPTEESATNIEAIKAKKKEADSCYQQRTVAQMNCLETQNKCINEKCATKRENCNICDDEEKVCAYDANQSLSSCIEKVERKYTEYPDFLSSIAS